MTFTVAITVFGSEHLLPHALQTVLAQTVKPVEVRLYSDGPSPLAKTIIDQLRPDLPITYESLERRYGLHGNHLRRRALEQARGSHVCILGHDCLLYPTYLESHVNNLQGAENGLSVVPIAYWRGTLRDASQPKRTDLMALKDGEIDLLCIAYPRVLALHTDCFGEDMQTQRCADFLSFDRLRGLTLPRFRQIPEQAAHF